jgi:hypothetical protein
VFEAPRKTKTVQKLREKAAHSETFCQLVCALRELMVEHCASANHMRQALTLATHEQAWSNYRIQQGIVPEPVEDDEIEDDEDEGAI